MLIFCIIESVIYNRLRIADCTLQIVHYALPIAHCILIISADSQTRKLHDNKKAQDKQVTDKELIRKVHSGNKEALNTIVSRYYDDIYRFCLYLTGQETDSYDITQDVFLRFIKYVDSYEYRNLKGYLLIIARNLCRDYFHHKKDISCIEDITSSGTEDRHLNNLENQILLWEALQKLPIKQREIIVLRIYEEMRFHEIAEILGINLSTVKSRFRLGVISLRKLMEAADD